MSSAPAVRDHPAIDEMEELLCRVAGGLPPNRSEAIAYSRCRSDLLASPAKDLLPGFVYQCLTVFKFREFITLYDPDTALREAFVRRTFERCRAMLDTLGSPPEASAPATQDRSDPQHWML